MFLIGCMLCVLLILVLVDAYKMHKSIAEGKSNGWGDY